ncbi:MAG: hypothetical protein RBT32_08410 [Methanothermobacter sp.]|nr:hypothetical protein [Methanothermobacter tenebrarum]MDD3455009.1 hypothetical protein [Methanobacteriales archaeon]MDX9694136.1 hypothetical protein [Methanothermobacter sp.]HOQ20509.1 hypothetical protein [Methanothermobacter sp.]
MRPLHTIEDILVYLAYEPGVSTTLVYNRQTNYEKPRSSKGHPPE